jgi:hypothetical protein
MRGDRRNSHSERETESRGRLRTLILVGALSRFGWAVFQASPVSMHHAHGLNSYVDKLINGAICVEGVLVGTGCPP